MNAVPTRTPTRDLDAVLDATRPLWDDLSGARVFLTGTTGFIGTWMLESLAWARERLGIDVRVVALVRDQERLKTRLPHLADASWLQFEIADVRNCKLPAGAVDFLVHTASTATPRQIAATPLDVQDMVVRGTRHVTQLSRSAGAKRALLVSSGSVYGSFVTPSAPIAEDTPCGPDPLLPENALAGAKRLAESVGILVGRETGLEVVVARGFAMSGPWLPLDADFALGNFAGDALARRPIHISGDGTAVRSFLYGSDMAAWLWTILLRGTAGRAYNVGSESPVTISEAAQTVSQITGLPIERALEPVAGAAASWFVPSTRRSCKELGLESRVGLADGVRRMLEWHRCD